VIGILSHSKFVGLKTIDGQIVPLLLLDLWDRPSLGVSNFAGYPNPSFSIKDAFVGIVLLSERTLADS
jgi:hypothetical protein